MNYNKLVAYLNAMTNLEVSSNKWEIVINILYYAACACIGWQAPKLHVYLTSRGLSSARSVVTLLLLAFLVGAVLNELKLLAWGYV